MVYVSIDAHCSDSVARTRRMRSTYNEWNIRATIDMGGNSMNSQVGKQAFAFELTDTAGKVYRLSDFDGQWLLLMFHRHLG